MIKKRYLMILSVAIVSVLLGSLLYNNIAQAQKAKEHTEVDVINLPIDEQGNLKVKVVEENPLQGHLGFSVVALSLANLTYEPYLSYEFLLVHSTVSPSVYSFTYWHGSNDYIGVFSETFIQDTCTQNSYSIQGEVFVSVHFVINFPMGDGNAWFKGAASLDKVGRNGTQVNIASWNIAEIGNLD